MGVSDFSFTCYNQETNNLATWKYKKGHYSDENCRKIVIIEHDLELHEIHIYIIPIFNLTHRLQVITRKPIGDGHMQNTHNYSTLRRCVRGQQ
jgi:hypothetical protein